MSAIKNVARRRTRCPRCDVPLAPVKSGETLLAGCGKCRGVWVDRKVFDKICKRDSTPRKFGAAREMRGNRSATTQNVKCPVCYYWMDAKNFENYPELVVDVCRRHGTWLDANELQAILRIVKERKGGSVAASASETGPPTIPTAAIGGTALAGVAAVSGSLMALNSSPQNRSPLERSGEFVSELLDAIDIVEVVDIGDVGDIAMSVAEIGFSLFDGL